MKLFISKLIACSVLLTSCGDNRIDPGDMSLTSGELSKGHDWDVSEATSFLYREDFSVSADGWLRVAGPGLLEVQDGVFQHTTTDWCEYAYVPRTIGNANYLVDVFVTEHAVNIAFVWRAPDTARVTETGGAYQATFNSSLIPGHFTFEKFDPLGRTLLLDIPETFLGLNYLRIEDRGRFVTLHINGVNYGSFDIQGLTRPERGYMVLIAGDLGTGDYFDNVKVWNR